MYKGICQISFEDEVEDDMQVQVKRLEARTDSRGQRYAQRCKLKAGLIYGAWSVHAGGGTKQRGYT